METTEIQPGKHSYIVSTNATSSVVGFLTNTSNRHKNQLVHRNVQKIDIICFVKLQFVKFFVEMQKDPSLFIRVSTTAKQEDTNPCILVYPPKTLRPDISTHNDVSRRLRDATTRRFPATSSDGPIFLSSGGIVAHMVSVVDNPTDYGQRAICFRPLRVTPSGLHGGILKRKLL
jgi:hypothetical protein